MGKYVTISNPTGIHARPASQLVALCQQYRAEIKLECEERGIQVNPKSIFSLLAGRLVSGTTVKVEADGEDAQRAEDEVCAFIEALEE